MQCRECRSELIYSLRKERLTKGLLVVLVPSVLLSLLCASFDENTIPFWNTVFIMVTLVLWTVVVAIVVAIFSTSPSAFSEESDLCRSCVRKREEAERKAEEARKNTRIQESVVEGAKNLERARRYEDAARLYESAGLWDEAGKARSKATSQTVKHISVNINDLVDKLRMGGLAVPYKCGNCGAIITVDKNSKVAGLKSCSYCGGSINMDALAKLIEDALS